MSDSTDIRTVGVLGLGLLGRSIAACLLGSGLWVVGYARRRETREQADVYIDAAIAEMIEHGAAATEVGEAWRGNYTASDDMKLLASCDFVIESVVEDLSVKEDVFGQIEAIVGENVPIATNTSALPISVLQRNRRNPARFIGMHWAEPCHITRFLEIICGELTSQSTLESALALARRTHKEPSIVRKDVEGFIANRLGYAMYREAFHILESGVADAETIDRSFRNAVGLWATICGPFRWMDLTGLTGYAAVMKRLLPQLSNDTSMPSTMTALVESGADGIKNGRGFYDYTKEEAKRWEHLLHEHAWKIREWTDRHFPLSDA